MRPGCCLAAGLAAQLCDHKGESGWNLTKNGEAGMPAGSEMASLTAGACDPLVAAVNAPVAEWPCRPGSDTNRATKRRQTASGWLLRHYASGFCFVPQCRLSPSISETGRVAGGGWRSESSCSSWGLGRVSVVVIVQAAFGPEISNRSAPMDLFRLRLGWAPEAPSFGPARFHGSLRPRSGGRLAQKAGRGTGAPVGGAWMESEAGRGAACLC